MFLVILLYANNHAGELEGCLLKSFLKAAKLRRWLARPDCPPAIKECKVLFDKAYASQHDGYHWDAGLASQGNISPALISAPMDLQHLVKKKVTLHAYLKLGRVTFARSSTHLGDSLIYFYADGIQSLGPVPGCIKYIFEVDSISSFTVQRQLPFRGGSVNPFQYYPHFPADLYSAELSPNLEVVKVEWVMCHFARVVLTSEFVAILSLSLVRYTSI
ncbi:hypothetical protein BU17DRAFT_47916 [Hysterangium stoloniferum]|nr:hypothetical protein BU17DRAFT_47916 [Hysterangium stoloniferum]